MCFLLTVGVLSDTEKIEYYQGFSHLKLHNRINVLPIITVRNIKQEGPENTKNKSHSGNTFTSALTAK